MLFFLFTRTVDVGVNTSYCYLLVNMWTEVSHYDLKIFKVDELAVCKQPQMGR